MEPDERRHVPHTEIHHLSRRFLEAAQDILVVELVLVLFGLMVRTMFILLSHLFGPALDFRVVIAEVLFMLVMVELMRLLVVYLEEHRVAVDFMVELGIVATLREVVLRGLSSSVGHRCSRSARFSSRWARCCGSARRGCRFLLDALRLDRPTRGGRAIPNRYRLPIRRP